MMQAECRKIREPVVPLGHAWAALLGAFLLTWAASPALADWRAADREAVGRLQHQLDWIGRYLGIGNVTVDGALGRQTRNAVEATARFYGVPFDAMPFAEMAGGIAAVRAGFDGAAWLEMNVADNRPAVPPAGVPAPSLDPGLRAGMTLGPIRMDVALPQAAALAYAELLALGAGPPLSDSVYMKADDTPPGSYRRYLVVLRPDGDGAIVLYRNADQASNTVSAAERLRQLEGAESTRALLDGLADRHGPPAWGEQTGAAGAVIRLAWPARPTEASALADCVALLLHGNAAGVGALRSGATADPASHVGPLLTPSPEIRHAPCGPLRVAVLSLDDVGAPQLLREIIADTDELARVWLARLDAPGAGGEPLKPELPPETPTVVSQASMVPTTEAGLSDFQHQRCDRIASTGPSTARFWLNDAHRHAVETMDITNLSARWHSMHLALDELDGQIAAAIAGQGPRSAVLAVLRLDRATIALEIDSGDRAAQQERREAYALLMETAQEPGQAGMLLDLAERLASGRAAQVAVLQRHARAAGPSPQRIQLLAAVLADAEIQARLAAESGRFEPEIDAATRIGLARDMLDIAQAAGHPRAAYEAQARLLRALLDAGQQDEAAAMAIALMPSAVARLEHTRDWAGPGPVMADPDPGARHGMGADPRSLRDCWAIYGVMDSLLATLPIDADTSLFAQAAFWRGHEIALFADLGSEQPFWAQLAALQPLLGADLREVMRFMARTAGHHQDIDTLPAIYMARRAAEYLEAVLEPRQARQWRAMMAEWQDEGAAVAISGRPATAAEALQLADLSEATGNPAAAVEHLRAAWDMQAREGDGSTGAAVEDRIHDHLLGRYCTGCDEALAPLLAEVWARNMDRREEPLMGMSGPSRAFALYLSRSDSASVSDDQRAQAQTVLVRPVRFDDRSDRDIEARFDRAGLAPDRRLMLRILIDAFPESGLRTLDAFLQTDPAERARMLADHVYGVMMHFEEFGITAAGFDAFASYLRLLDAAGEAEAALTVARALVDLSREAFPVQVGSITLRWVPPTEEGRVMLAHVLAPAHLRLARHALIEGRAAHADEHMTAGHALIEGRLAMVQNPNETIRLRRHFRVATLMLSVLADRL